MKKKHEVILEKYLKDEKGKFAALAYLRGRRRVGKTTLLEKMKKAYQENTFMFVGHEDETASNILLRFVNEWCEFEKNSDLKNIKESVLTWKFIFKDLAKRKKKTIILLDEIQWIAKTQSGFIGSLKESWSLLEKNSKLKFVICGSSNKFFYQKTGGEEQILRGLKTHSDIWVKPFSINQIKDHYTNQLWNNEQIISAYKMLGGIPYYWNQVKWENGFFQSMNDVFCKPQSIFLEEFQEILRLEFNKQGVVRASTILEAIGAKSITMKAIGEATGIVASTLGDMLEKLVDYNILCLKRPCFSPVGQKERGSLFAINDFHLAFYFEILRKKKRKIIGNHTGEMLFASWFQSKENFTLQNFSGLAFENIVKDALMNSDNRHELIFQKLKISEHLEIEVMTHWDRFCQLDVVIKAEDEIFRFLECKWTHSDELIKNAILNFDNRTAHLKMQKINAIVSNHPHLEKFNNLAKQFHIELISLSDII